MIQYACILSENKTRTQLQSILLSILRMFRQQGCGDTLIINNYILYVLSKMVGSDRSIQSISTIPGTYLNMYVHLVFKIFLNLHIDTFNHCTFILYIDTHKYNILPNTLRTVKTSHYIFMVPYGTYVRMFSLGVRNSYTRCMIISSRVVCGKWCIEWALEKNLQSSIHQFINSSIPQDGIAHLLFFLYQVQSYPPRLN